MTRRRLALLLVLIGALLILDRIATTDGWLWTGLAAAGFLVAYARQRVRGLLVLGCVLAGIAAGLLLGGTGVPGAFWVALGISVMAIDRVEPEPDKRTFRIGAGLTAFGVLFGVASSGWLDDARFAIVLILVGILLLGRRGERSEERLG